MQPEGCGPFESAVCRFHAQMVSVHGLKRLKVELNVPHWHWALGIGHFGHWGHWPTTSGAQKTFNTQRSTYCDGRLSAGKEFGTVFLSHLVRETAVISPQNAGVVFVTYADVSCGCNARCRIDSAPLRSQPILLLSCFAAPFQLNMLSRSLVSWRTWAGGSSFDAKQPTGANRNGLTGD
jgi:hypothetical protein